MSPGGPLQLSPSAVVVAVTDQLSSELGGEAVILHMGRGVYFGLDEVGTRVWALVQKPRSVRDICRELQAEYDVDGARVERAVVTLLGEMFEAGLIESSDESAG